MARHIDVEGGFNVRDLGGFTTHDGCVTREKVLIRAGSLQNISAAGQQELVDYGVKMIVDLRDEWEVKEYPSAFAQSTVVKALNMPVIGDHFSQDKGWQSETDRYAALYELYAHYLERCQPQLGTIMATIMESEATTLYHCYAGKDRTGIVTALLLGAVGVADEAIADDYAATTANISHLRPQWRAYAIAHNEDMARHERNSSSEAHTMVNLLAHIREQYGDVTDYLHVCGVTERQIEGLKSRWVI